MSIETNFTLVVTEMDRALASEAMIDGHCNCQMTKFRMDPLVEKCDCDFGAIDGCKARLEAIAKVIAGARIMG